MLRETRVVNKYKESYDVWIGRGSKWGNPFTHLPLGETKAQFQVASREEAIWRYEQWIRSNPALIADLTELVGKRLGCVCHPKACHGHVLVKLIEEVILNK